MVAYALHYGLYSPIDFSLIEYCLGIANIAIYQALEQYMDWSVYYHG